MKNTVPKVVVITGATAGIGRATACEFARQGAHIALLARDEQRLDETKLEVESLGGKAITVPTDVSNAAQVEAAADLVEQQLGPIDIWVNNAMATVFAPIAEISPEDYQRVTDVTYHGYVWGTMAALKRMRSRDCGTIVQVSSALAHRSIPLQSPYCGAKHAVNGFTESVRTELLNEKSKVHITVVDMPGINTPQFDWCKTTLSHHPKPMGTYFQPEVAARAIAYAAHARRREIFVGAPSALAIIGQKFAPGLLDWYLGRTGVKGQQMAEAIPADRPDNLWQPVPGPHGAHGSFDEHAHPRSPQLWLTMHRQWFLAGGIALGLWAALRRQRSGRQRRLGT